jgi:hypothetical protein
LSFEIVDFHVSLVNNFECFKFKEKFNGVSSLMNSDYLWGGQWLDPYQSVRVSSITSIPSCPGFPFSNQQAILLASLLALDFPFSNQ